MKYISCRNISVALTLFLYVHLSDASTVNADLNFSLTYTSESCDVASGSKLVKVPMGTWDSSIFAKVGSSSPAMPFQIEINCNGVNNTGVEIGFYGDADEHNSQLLALTGADSAQGIGISIFNDQGEEVTLNSPGKTIYPENGISILRFTASYVATVLPVVSGNANAVATFSLVYP